MTTKSESASRQGAEARRVLQPDWAQKLLGMYRSGISRNFILSGNVQDYIVGTSMLLRDYLIRLLTQQGGEQMSIVVYYNRSAGFYFPSPPMRKDFIQATGLLEKVKRQLEGQAALGVSQGLLSAAINTTYRQAYPADGEAYELFLQKEAEAYLEEIGQQPLLALNLLTKLLRHRPENRSRTQQEEAQQPALRTNGERSPDLASPGDAKEFKVAVIIDYAETVAPAYDQGASEADRICYVTLAEWGRDPSIPENNMMLLLTVDWSALHEQLRRGGTRWERIQMSFPSLQERASFFENLVEDDDDLQLAQGVSYQDIARHTYGLRSIDLETLALEASFRGDPITLRLVSAGKRAIMLKELNSALLPIESKTGFGELGGIEEIAAALQRWFIEPMRLGLYERCPLGVLFMGPTGTGKSSIARAISFEAALNCVEFQPNNLKTKWVGETERKIEETIEVIKAMIPCLVFWDETDQGLARGGMGDSGVSSHLFKRILEIMADNSLRGKVLWVGASVTGETPVLVRAPGAPACLRPIAEVIDPSFVGDEMGEVAVPGLETLAVLPDQRVGWSRVRSIYRHVVDEVYDIAYAGTAACLTTTGDHSVFVLDEEARVVPRPVLDLRPGDLLVTPLRGSNALAPAPQTVVDEDLAWLLGLLTAADFPAPGWAVLRGVKERAACVRLASQIGERLGADIPTLVGDGGGLQIHLPAGWGEAIQAILQDDVHGTQIPSALWTAERSVVLAYLRGWQDGCGSVQITTGSRSLAYGALWLLRLHGVAGHVTEPAAPTPSSEGGSGRSPVGARFTLRLPDSVDAWGDTEERSAPGEAAIPLSMLQRARELLGPRVDQNSALEYPPIGDPPGQFVSRAEARRLLERMYEQRAQDDPICGRVLQFIDGDLGLSPVRHITRKGGPAVVYDFCGCDNECFIGGGVPAMLHNTNRPDLLDPALLRRFEHKVPVLVGDDAQRARVLALHVTQAFKQEQGSRVPTQKDFEELAREMVEYTPAEIELVVRKAVELWETSRKGSSTVIAVLRDAFDRIIPTTQDIYRMTSEALARATDLDVIPERYRPLAADIRRRRLEERRGRQVTDEDVRPGPTDSGSEEGTIALFEGRRRSRSKGHSSLEE